MQVAAPVYVQVASQLAARLAPRIAAQVAAQLASHAASLVLASLFLFLLIKFCLGWQALEEICSQILPPSMSPIELARIQGQVLASPPASPQLASPLPASRPQQASLLQVSPPTFSLPSPFGVISLLVLSHICRAE